MKNRKFADGPVWFDGTNINEALFCDEFLSRQKSSLPMALSSHRTVE